MNCANVHTTHMTNVPRSHLRPLMMALEKRATLRAILPRPPLQSSQRKISPHRSIGCPRQRLEFLGRCGKVGDGVSGGQCGKVGDGVSGGNGGEGGDGDWLM